MITEFLILARSKFRKSNFKSRDIIGQGNECDNFRYETQGKAPKDSFRFQSVKINLEIVFRVKFVIFSNKVQWPDFCELLGFNSKAMIKMCYL